MDKTRVNGDLQQAGLSRLGLDQGERYQFHTLDGCTFEGNLSGVGVRYADGKIETVTVTLPIGDTFIRWDTIRSFRKVKDFS